MPYMRRILDIKKVFRDPDQGLPVFSSLCRRAHLNGKRELKSDEIRCAARVFRVLTIFRPGV